MPLLEGDAETRCTLAEFEAGYDYALGIDVILRFNSGMESTLQEKFLFTRFKTVTVEYMQDWANDVRGDWFKMRAQYYFVGYDRNKSCTFQDWILLNWPATQQATAQNLIAWDCRPNLEDGARANFRFAHFDIFPPFCVVACSDLSRTLDRTIAAIEDGIAPVEMRQLKMALEAHIPENNHAQRSTVARAMGVSGRTR
jgi:hypothetical protein